MTLCYLGLGSNLQTPIRQLMQAKAKLGKLPRTTILKTSGLYFSPPMGMRSQPPYVNLVMAIQTTLSPSRLLRCCQAVEDKQQRLRKVRWGARTLDIDILLYGNRVINTLDLKVPHPEMRHRDFVRIPLLELTHPHHSATIFLGIP